MALTRFAITAAIIIESEDQHAASEVIAAALVDHPVRSVAILGIEAHGPSAALELLPTGNVIDLRSADRAFHKLHDAVRVLRGDYLLSSELADAVASLESCQHDLGELYVLAIRECRYAAKVEIANSHLMEERGVMTREIAALKAEFTAAVTSLPTSALRVS